MRGGNKHRQTYRSKRGGHYEFERVLAPYGVRTGAEAALQSVDPTGYNMIESKVSVINNLPESSKTALVQPINKLVDVAAPIPSKDAYYRAEMAKYSDLGSRIRAIEKVQSDASAAFGPSARTAASDATMKFMKYYNDTF
jgi:hypothetical protein